MPIQGTGTEIILIIIAVLVMISIIGAVIIWLKSKETYLKKYKE